MTITEYVDFTHDAEVDAPTENGTRGGGGDDEPAARDLRREREERHNTQTAMNAENMHFFSVPPVPLIEHIENEARRTILNGGEEYTS